jgi:hypothetical protein
VVLIYFVGSPSDGDSMRVITQGKMDAMIWDAPLTPIPLLSHLITHQNGQQTVHRVFVDIDVDTRTIACCPASLAAA